MTGSMARRLGAAAILLGCGMTTGWAQQDGDASASNASTPIAAAPLPMDGGKHGKKKAAYSGPNTVVELAPTPMLDEEGRQREDPQGNPMFNPGVKQLRDKHGHPVFDDGGKPLMQTVSGRGYDEHGKKIKAKKEKAPKTISVSIARGTYTVDGMAAKAGLNYDIKDLRYIYFYAPWIGVTVISASPFPGAKEEKSAFSDRTLTVNVEDHVLQLYSDTRLLGKKPASAYVAVDRTFKLPSRLPEIGYGATLHAPYTWPGSKENAALKGPVAPPALPATLRPTALLPSCPAGQMRKAAKPALPGETAKPAPCEAIGQVAGVDQQQGSEIRQVAKN